MAAHGQLDRIGDHFPRHERGLHSLMAHGDATGTVFRAELGRAPARRANTLFHSLSLAHKSDVARSGFVPAGRDANQGLVDLLAGKSHGVEIRAMRRPRRAFRHMPEGTS